MQGRTNVYRYTDKERKQLLDSLTILVDTREQTTSHVSSYLDRKGVEHKEKALNFGDYSFYLPADPDLGIMRPVYFDGELVVERKANLEELSRCFAQDRSRFEAELIRAQGAGAKVVLLVEVARGYAKVVAGEYGTDYNPRSFVATLFSFAHRYNLQVSFIPGRLAGNFIYHCFRYWLREFLK